MAVAIITENTSGGDFTGLTSTYIRTDGEEDSNFASDTADIIGRASAQYRSLIRPSGLSNITAPVTVTAATLQLYVTTQSAAMDAELWAVVRNWVLAQVTWNNYATATAWATAGGMGSGDIDASSSGAYTMAESTGAYQTLTLTGNALTNLQDWINGGRTNNGWLLAPSPDTATRYRFYTSDGGTDGQRPILTVTYSAAASTSGAGVNRGLVNGGTNGGINGGLIRRSMETARKVGSLWLPGDNRIIRPRYVPGFSF